MKKFIKKELIQWNSGWSPKVEENGYPKGYVWNDGYEFGSYSKELGYAIIYEIDCRYKNSFTVPLDNIRKIPSEMSQYYKNIIVTDVLKFKSETEGFAVLWDCEGIGHGQITVGFSDGVIKLDTECMGNDFVKQVLCKMVDQAK